MENLKFLHLSWDDVQALAERVAGKIEGSGFRPDLIVAVSRGGFDPARILCDQLMIRDLVSLQIVYYKGVNERREAPEVRYPVNADVSGLVVLVVDDVSDSGNSLIVARDYLEGLGVGEVRVATLHYKPWSGYRPDYFADETDRWIVYPWEPKESILAIAERLRVEGFPGELLGERLVGLGFKPSDVEKYLG